MRCFLLLSLLVTATTVSAESGYPTHDALASGAWQVRPLPGQTGVVFTMYGAPGELEPLRSLAGVMQAEHLGNGFDPGPGPYASAQPAIDYIASLGWPLIGYPGGDMQILGGRGPLGKENAAAYAPLDRAGVFSAVQLGEWGYYFHNLSCNPGWMHDVFGKDFDQYAHLLKPKGLAGYDHLPASKQECFDIVQAYFTGKSRDLMDRVISVTGHSHYEAYAGEWGARCIGLELGENIAFTQSKLAFARGAARQWQKPWSVQVSPWMAGAVTCSGPLRIENGGARGLDAGHSLSFYERMWLHAWFAGAAMVTPENSIATFFEKPEAPWTLTPHGVRAKEVFAFMQAHDRGVPYAPIAIVLDHLAGYNAFMDKPWGILEPTPGDRELRDLFDAQLFPGSDHIHRPPNRDNPEDSYLRPTPYGESFDVLLTNARPGLLAAYPAIVVAGDVTFDATFVTSLQKALDAGSRVFLAQRHRDALGDTYDQLAKHGPVEVLPPWTNPATSRPAAIPNDTLAQLTTALLPIAVEGDAIEYQINRTPKGWVVELINNRGVAKKKDQPAGIDPTAIARVQLTPRFKCASIHPWRTAQSLNPNTPATIEVGPGATEFVEFTAAD